MPDSTPSIVASAEHYREYPRDFAGPLDDLRAPLKPLCRAHVRRVDRLIQLALIGSALCVGTRPLAADTGIYLASGLGPVGSTAAVQHQMFADQTLPKPVQFINTLANTAGFYVARNLGLDHQCLFISRGYTSFEAALELAIDDLTLGVVGAALVGMVDECTLPLNQHGRRLHQPQATALAEGSLWLLLTVGSARGSAHLESSRSVSGHDELARWLGEQPPHAHYWSSPTLDDAAGKTMRFIAQRRDWQPWPGPVGESPLRAAVAAVRFCRAGCAGTLVSVNADGCDCYRVSRYRVG